MPPDTLVPNSDSLGSRAQHGQSAQCAGDQQLNPPKVLASAATGAADLFASRVGDADRIFGEAAKKTGEDTFGLELGRQFQPRLLGPLGSVAIGSMTLAAALRSKAHWFPARQGQTDRDFQRHLKEHGLAFPDLLRAARQELALHYIADRDMPLTGIAYNLGYSELSAFSRAFRSWTGMTPQRYRCTAMARPLPARSSGGE